MIRRATIAALALGLAACGDAEVRKSAARDAHAFLAAAQAGDRKTFRAYIDRPALRADLRRQLEAQARAQGDLRPFDEGAINRMIEPEAFSIQGVTGLGLSGVPGPGQVALMMKVLPDGRACLVEPAIPPRCVLTFQQQGSRWRLVQVAAGDMDIVRSPRP